MRNEATIIEKCRRLVEQYYYIREANVCDVVKGNLAACELIYSILCNHTRALDLDEIRTINYHLMMEKLEELDIKQLDIILDIAESEHILVSRMPIFHILSVDDNNTIRNQMYAADIIFHEDISLWKLIVKQFAGYTWADFNGVVNDRFEFDSFFYGGEPIEKNHPAYLVIYHMYYMDNKFLVRGKIIDKYKKLHII